MNNETDRITSLPSCPDNSGTMPACAGLAVAYVPFQQNGAKKYNQNEALSNGTLYPGLNLPFHMKTQGSEVATSPLTELQALEFVVLELGLYLDTHPEDLEANSLFKQYTTMEKSARAAYEAQYGPLMKNAAITGEKHSWLQEPWPWNYAQNEVK